MKNKIVKEIKPGERILIASSVTIVVIAAVGALIWGIITHTAVVFTVLAWIVCIVIGLMITLAIFNTIYKAIYGEDFFE